MSASADTASHYTAAAVWRIAAPMIISNLSLPLLGVVDTAVMGHLPAPYYLGAVAIGAVVFSFLFMGVNFLRMGTTGLAAQAFGSGDFDELRTVLAQALLAALAIAAVLLVFQYPLRELALAALSPSGKVLEYARVYFDVRIWSAPLVLANFVFVGWFLGVQNARAALWLMLTVSLSNIALDLWFVLGLGMDVKGVALATVLAEGCALILALAIVRRVLGNHPGRWRREHILNFSRIRKVVAFNADLLMRTLALMFSFAFLTAQGARMGDLVLAANAVLLNFQSIASYGLDGLAHAAEALVGRAVGARDREGFARAVSICLRWSLWFAVGMSAVFALAGPGLIDLMTDLEDVRGSARQYLGWLIALPLISVWCFLYDGVFVGATRARQMRNSMVLAVVLVYLPAWYLLQGFGNHGLWAAFALFMGARGISMHWYHQRMPAIG